MTKIPIFVITHDRSEVLKQSLESYYRYIDTPFEIVIFDQKSTFGPTVNYLKSLEANGIPVIWNPRNGAMPEMCEDLRVVIQEWLLLNPAPYYIVTDPDIALDGCGRDILEFYASLLQMFNDITCVGPMLRIDDIPDHYPFKEEAIKRHYKQFWGNVPRVITYKNLKYHILPSMIDTTFAMYRSDFAFKNLNVGIRTYAPYMAQHLDWYIDPNNMTDDQLYYMKQANHHVAHWGAGFLRWSLENNGETKLPF